MKERPKVFAKNVEDLVAKIIVLRNLNPSETEVQIGIDDGQGQLKVCLSFCNQTIKKLRINLLGCDDCEREVPD